MKNPAIQWGIPGAKYPEKDIYELMKRKERSLSEFIATFHYLPEEVAVGVFTAIQQDEDMGRGNAQAQMFEHIRKVSLADVSWYVRVVEKFPQLCSSRSVVGKVLLHFAPVITWADYAKKLGYRDRHDFIDAYNGISHKVEMFLKSRAQQAA